jgi:hypothetical protein
MAFNVALNLYRNLSGDLQSGISTEWQEGQAPEIISFSGTFAEGNEITLNTYNVSSEGEQIFFTDFSDGVVGQRDNNFYYWNGVGTADYLISDAVVDAPLGTGKVFRAHPTQQTFTEIHYQLPQDTDEIYVEAWARTNRVDFTSSPDAPQIKSFRLVDATGEVSMQDRPLNVAILFDSAGDLQVSASPVVGNGGWFGTAPNNTTWAKYTLYARKGDEGVANGERFVHVGAENSFTFSGIPGGHFASPSGTVASSEYAGEQITMHTEAVESYHFRRVALPYFQRTQQETISDICYFFVKNSKEDIIIGDASTWAACDQTKTYGIPYTTRAFGQVVFNARESALIAGDCWVYIRNYDGMVNPNGLRVRDI